MLLEIGSRSAGAADSDRLLRGHVLCQKSQTLRPFLLAETVGGKVPDLVVSSCHGEKLRKF